MAEKKSDDHPTSLEEDIESAVGPILQSLAYTAIDTGDNLSLDPLIQPSESKEDSVDKKLSPTAKEINDDAMAYAVGQSTETPTDRSAGDDSEKKIQASSPEDDITVEPILNSFAATASAQIDFELLAQEPPDPPSVASLPAVTVASATGTHMPMPMPMAMPPPPTGLDPPRPPLGHPLPLAIPRPSKSATISNPLEVVALKKPPPVQRAQAPAPNQDGSARSKPRAIQSGTERLSSINQYPPDPTSYPHPEQVSSQHLRRFQRPTIPAGWLRGPLPTEAERVRQMQSQSILALAERLFNETEREQMRAAAASRLVARSAASAEEFHGAGRHAVPASNRRHGERPDAAESSSDSLSQGAVSRRGRTRESKRGRNR